MSERAKRAISYLEQGDVPLARLETMGLSSTDLEEVLGGVAWGDRVPEDMRTAVERLYDARRAAEEEAGLAVPVVTVKPEGGRWKLIAGLGALVAAGAACWILLR